MEKRSKFYLTREARQQIGDLEATHPRAALWYAEERKGRLVDLSELQEQRGLLASLERFRANLGLKAHGFVNKVLAWPGGDFTRMFEVDGIVKADVGKVGTH